MEVHSPSPKRLRETGAQEERPRCLVRASAVSALASTNPFYGEQNCSHSPSLPKAKERGTSLLGDDGTPGRLKVFAWLGPWALSHARLTQSGPWGKQRATREERTCASQTVPEDLRPGHTPSTASVLEPKTFWGWSGSGPCRQRPGAPSAPSAAPLGPGCCQPMSLSPWKDAAGGRGFCFRLPKHSPQSLQPRK